MLGQVIENLVMKKSAGRVPPSCNIALFPDMEFCTNLTQMGIWVMNITYFLCANYGPFNDEQQNTKTGLTPMLH